MIKRHSFHVEMLPRRMFHVDSDVGTGMVMYESVSSRKKNGYSGSIVTKPCDALTTKIRKIL